MSLPRVVRPPDFFWGVKMYGRIYKTQIMARKEHSKNDLECIQARNKIRDFLETNGELTMKLEKRK